MKIFPCLLLIFLSCTCYSQDQQIQNHYLDIELQKPFFPYHQHHTFFTSIFNMKGHYQINKLVGLDGRLSLSNYSWSYGSYSENQSTIGNPYIGITLKPFQRDALFKIGVYIPVVNKKKTKAIEVGTKGNINNFEAFLPNSIGLTFNVDYLHQFNDNFYAKIGAGVLGSIYTQNGWRGGNDDYPLYLPGHDRFEMFLDYNPLLGFRLNNFGMELEIKGRYHSSEPYAVNRLSYQQLQFGSKYRIGQFEPGVFMRISINHVTKINNTFVLGLNIKSYI